MDLQQQKTRIAPEIRVIGVVMVCLGVGMLATATSNIWYQLFEEAQVREQISSFLTEGLKIFSQVKLVLSFFLSGVLVVSGYSLVKQKAWAYPFAVWTMIVFVFYLVGVLDFFYAMLSVTWQNLYAPLSRVFTSLIQNGPYYLILLGFLLTSGMPMQPASSRSFIARLQRLAWRGRAYLPASLPPVISLIALVLIISVIQPVWNLWYTVWHWQDIMFGISTVAPGERWMFYVHEGMTIFAITAIIAGVGLLRHARWATYLALAYLLVSVIEPLVLGTIALIRPVAADSVIPEYFLFAIAINNLLQKIPLAVMAAILWKYRSGGSAGTGTTPDPLPEGEGEAVA